MEKDTVSGIIVSPGLLEVVLDKPQEEKKIEIFYTNNTNAPITLEIFPIDFKQQDIRGGISFLGKDSGNFSYSLSSFLSFQTNFLKLDPQEKKSIQLTVKNRDDLSPGGHYAAVIARMLISENEDTSAMRVAPSLSSMILLRKTGGERFNLTLRSVDYNGGAIAFSYTSHMSILFNNQGNVHLVPYGRVEVRDMFGRLVRQGTVNTGSLPVFPESQRSIDIDVQKITTSLPISINSLTIKGQDSLKKTTYSYADTFIYIHPLFLLILVAAISLFIYRRRRKNI